MRNSMRRTSILASLVCAAVAVAARADAPADTTKTAVPATTTTSPVAAVESDAAPATTTANGKVVLRENLYYYDAFNRRDDNRAVQPLISPTASAA